MRILLVEDDQELQGQLIRKFERMDYQLSVANDGIEALYYAKEYTIDVAIIDLGLPKLDGIELIQRLRDEEHHFPILILTARTGWKTKVSGLEAGADDYLTKPFQPEELTARIKALLRRSMGFTQSRLTIGPVTINNSTSAVYVDDEEINLTAFEFKVLQHFMINPRKIITKSTLIDILYANDDDRDSNVVEVIIARLRKKIDPANTRKPIETLRGRGYRFIGDQPS